MIIEEFKGREMHYPCDSKCIRSRILDSNIVQFKISICQNSYENYDNGGKQCNSNEEHNVDFVYAYCLHFGFG